MKKKIISIALVIIIASSMMTMSSSALFGITYTYAPYTSFGGNLVEAGTASREFSTSELIYLAEEASQYTSLQPISPPSSRYNCHSYAWCSEQYYAVHWVNSISAYLSDGHTAQISMPVPGCLAVYYDDTNSITHSAVVTSVDDGIFVYSKWGNWGLYYHDLLIVPQEYVGTHGRVEYYSRNLSHDEIYTNITSTHHTKKCSHCNGLSETSTHTFSYSQYNNNYHKATCTECGYSTYESHTSGNTCTKCGYAH